MESLVLDYGSKTMVRRNALDEEYERELEKEEEEEIERENPPSQKPAVEEIWKFGNLLLNNPGIEVPRLVPTLLSLGKVFTETSLARNILEAFSLDLKWESAHPIGLSYAMFRF